MIYKNILDQCCPRNTSRKFLENIKLILFLHYQPYQLKKKKKLGPGAMA